MLKTIRASLVFFFLVSFWDITQINCAYRTNAQSTLTSEIADQDGMRGEFLAVPELALHLFDIRMQALTNL